MARVDIPLPRARITETPTGLLITIPANRNWFVVLFVGFWMCGWLFGEYAVIIYAGERQDTSSGKPVPAGDGSGRMVRRWSIHRISMAVERREVKN